MQFTQIRRPSAHSLAEFYVESRTNVPEARKWLNHLKDHLLEVEDSYYAQDHERLLEKLNSHGNRSAT